jgi:hypothetical protein
MACVTIIDTDGRFFNVIENSPRIDFATGGFAFQASRSRFITLVQAATKLNWNHSQLM